MGIRRSFVLLLAVLTVATMWAKALPAEPPSPGAEVAEASFPGDNGRLAFSCWNPTTSAYDLWTSAGDGADAHHFFSDARDPAWSPDGALLAMFSGDGIILVDRTGKIVDSSFAAGVTPSWAPDGTRLVYESREEGFQGLAIRERGADTYVRLFEGPAGRPKWSPDGKWIAFNAYEGGDFDKYRLYVIPAAGGTAKPIGDTPFLSHWDWAPDGSEIYFEAATNQLKAVRPTGGPPRAAGTFTIPGVEPDRHALGALAMSPDGKKIVAMKQQKGPDYELLFGPITGGRMKEVLVPCELNPSDAPSWQPLASRKIAGTVTRVTCGKDACERASLAGVKVTASAPSGKVSALTNAKGKYRLEGLAPGTYAVAASKGTGAKALTFVPDSISVDLAGKDVDDIDFATCGNPATPTSGGAPDPCLRIDVKTKTPHDGSISAGERADYTVTVHAPSDKGKVILTGTLPDARIATVVPGSITGGGKLVDGDITWTLNAASIKPVKFALKVKTRGLPVDERTLGVAFGAALGRQTARRSADLDFMPCGQDPAEYPASRAISGAGWSMTAGVDREYGLAVTNLRVGTSPAVTRLISPRISVPYFVLQTTKLAKLTTLRLRPNGNDAVGRSRLLELDLKDADWKAKRFEFHATYGIDHLGKGSGSCLLIKLTYQFSGYNADQSCNPLSKPGFVECSQFRPLLEYEFLGADGEKLRYIETAQRLVVDIGGQAKTSALIRDHDFPPVPIAKERQLTKETLELAISQGRAGVWDNFHVSTDPDFVDAPGDLVRGKVFACLECFHSHWRWGKFLTLTLPYDSNPIIPKGSKQTVFVGVVKPRSFEEGEEVESLLGDDVVRGGPVAYYWLASSGGASDSFFNHWNWVVPPGAFGSTTSEAAGRSALSRFVCPIHFNTDGLE